MSRKQVKKVAVSLVTGGVILFFAFCAVAGESATVSTDTFWKVVMALLGLLQVIALAFCSWLVINDRELFQRVGNLETAEGRQEEKLKAHRELCDERHSE